MLSFSTAVEEKSDWKINGELLEVLYLLKLGYLFGYLYIDLHACH